MAFVDTPDEAGCQQDDIYDDTRVEGHAQRVDEEQFEPAAHFHEDVYKRQLLTPSTASDKYCSCKR